MSAVRFPSVRALQEVFGENARQARKVLEMSRSELVALPAGAKRVRECYNPPDTHDVRMACLNALADTHGVEAFDTRKGVCEYLNAGDTYAVTLVYFQGRYRVTTCGDIVERWAA